MTGEGKFGGESILTLDLASQGPFRIGDVQVRPATLEVSYAHHVVRLEPRIMQVLVVLGRAPGEVVGRDVLIASCWGRRVVSTDALQRCISRLRRLGEESGAFAIEGIARVGYRLEPKAPPQDSRPAVQAARDIGPAGGARSEKHRWPIGRGPLLAWLAAAACVSASAVGVFVTLKVEQSPPRSITWIYEQGRGPDAPNGLRFWMSDDGRTWTESFADGRSRQTFTFVTHLQGPNGCEGVLTRRSDRALIVFVPDQGCRSQVLLAQDIDPSTGLVERNWFVLGKIVGAARPGVMRLD